MHVQYNLFLLSRMHSRKHIPACARVYLCVCTMRSLKFHTQPPPPHLRGGLRRGSKVSALRIRFQRAVVRLRAAAPTG